MILAQHGLDDYVIFDRYERVGGHSWLEMANRTTRLQTEFPTYHIWYGPDSSVPGVSKCGGPPHKWEIWPTADRLLEHFQLFAEEYGILPNIRFSTNVASMQIMGDLEDDDRFYRLSCEPRFYQRKQTQGGGALDHQVGGKKDSRDEHNTYKYEGDRIAGKSDYKIDVASISIFPGNLSFPRPVYYPGEETFGGFIDFGVEMRCDYKNVTGKTVVIHGHGAFTMENIRTCLEYSMKKIFLLCRKRNLTCPRMISWFINQSCPPAPAAACLDMLKIAYKHIDYDPWDMHSVNCDKNHKFATVMQKTRFGIGDVYFLAAAYGLMEIVVGNVKRCAPGALLLDNGQRLEADCIIKCTGCLGDWRVDKLCQIREMNGYWMNMDPRRCSTADPDGINASNFALTTGGPGIWSGSYLLMQFINFPYEWKRLQAEGVLNMLPVHKAGFPDHEFPAYMMTARHAQGSAILITGASPYLLSKTSPGDAYKHYIQHLVTPLDRVLADAKADWEKYEKHFRDSKMVPADAPYVEYPYDKEYMQDRLNELEKLNVNNLKFTPK